MEVIIDNDGKCTCSCADTCLFKKTGSAPRCTKEEIESLGYDTVVLPIYKKVFGNIYIRKPHNQWKKKLQ